MYYFQSADESNDAIRTLECFYIEVYPTSGFGRMLIAMSESETGSPDVQLEALSAGTIFCCIEISVQRE